MQFKKGDKVTIIRIDNDISPAHPLRQLIGKQDIGYVRYIESGSGCPFEVKFYTSHDGYGSYYFKESELELAKIPGQQLEFDFMSNDN